MTTPADESDDDAPEVDEARRDAGGDEAGGDGLPTGDSPDAHEPRDGVRPATDPVERAAEESRPAGPGRRLFRRRRPAGPPNPPPRRARAPWPIWSPSERAQRAAREAERVADGERASVARLRPDAVPPTESCVSVREFCVPVRRVARLSTRVLRSGTRVLRRGTRPLRPGRRTAGDGVTPPAT